MSFRHQIRVRYGECDQQGVVYNPNYMVYMDDATEVWISSGVPDGDYYSLGWEYMLARSALEWQGSARAGEILTIDLAIVRYGSSSFDVGYIGKVEDRPVFTARAVCVSVRPETYQKYPTPDAIDAGSTHGTWLRKEQREVRLARFEPGVELMLGEDLAVLRWSPAEGEP